MNAELARKLSNNYDNCDQLERVMAQIYVDALSGADGSVFNDLEADTIVLLLHRGFQVGEIVYNRARLVSW